MIAGQTAAEALRQRDEIEAGDKPPKVWTTYQWPIITAPWYKESSPGEYRSWTDTFEKARRIGGSEACAMRAICFALGRELQPDGTYIPRVPMSGVIISKDFAGAKELIAKIALNCMDLTAAGDADCARAEIHGTKIYFPTTGTTIRGLASTGTTIRSWTGFVILDEFAFVRNQEEVWGAARLVANPTLGNKYGFPMLIVTTPWEAGSLCHRIFTEETFHFRRHSVNIHQAKSAGFPIDIEEAFAELGIPELCETEYMCVWSHGGSGFFPAAKLNLCVRDDGKPKSMGKGTDLEETDDVCGLPHRWSAAPCFYGIDVGGGVGRDFTTCIQWRVIDDEYWIVGIKAFNHLDHDAQVDEIAKWIRKYPGEVRVDRGVGGLPMITSLQNRLGSTRVRISGAGMAPQDQEQYIKRMSQLLEANQLRLYAGMAAGGDKDGYRALILELAQMKAKLSGGRLHIETPRDELRGHCDRAWGALIGLSAQVSKSMMMGGSGGAYRPQIIPIDPDNTPIGFG